MTFEAYWRRLCAHPKNAGLNQNSTKITITAESFRIRLEKAYEAGQKDHDARYKFALDQIFKGIF